MGSDKNENAEINVVLLPDGNPPDSSSNSLAGVGWPASPTYPIRKRLKRCKSFGEEVIALGLIAEDEPELAVGDQMDIQYTVQSNERLSAFLLFVMEAAGILGTMLLAFCSGIFVGVLLYHPTVQVELYIEEVVWNGGVTIETSGSSELRLLGKAIYGMVVNNPSSFPGQLDFGQDMVAAVVPRGSDSSSNWLPIGNVTQKKTSNESIVLTEGEFMSYKFCLTINATLPMDDASRRLLSSRKSRQEDFGERRANRDSQRMFDFLDDPGSTSGCWNSTVGHGENGLLTSPKRKGYRSADGRLLQTANTGERRLEANFSTYVPGFPASMIDQCQSGWMLVSVFYSSLTSWCFGGYSQYPRVCTEPFAVPCMVIG